MWTATITGKELKEGKLLLTVTYSNQSQEVIEIITLDRKPDESYLPGVMAGKIQQLNELTDFANTIEIKEVIPVEDHLHTEEILISEVTPEETTGSLS